MSAVCGRGDAAMPYCQSVIKEKLSCKGCECPPTDDNMTRERGREREREGPSPKNQRAVSILFSIAEAAQI